MAASLPAMTIVRPLAILLLSFAMLPLAGCAWHKKSSSRIVEGDSPTIKYTNPESAGGRIGGRR